MPNKTQQPAQEERLAENLQHYVEELALTTQSFESVFEALKQKYNGRERNITVSFSLNLTELAILNAYAAAMGDASVSAALRSIIMGWFYSRSNMYQVSMNENSTFMEKTGI